MVLCGNVPVGVLQRAENIQAPGRPLGKARIASPDAELGATGDELVAIIHLAVERAHLPVVPPRARLDDLELRVEREGHARVLQRDVSVGLRVVHFRDDLVHPAGGEGRVRLGHVPSALGNPVGIGSHGVVLVEATDHEHRVVRQRDGRRIPACVLLVGGVRGLGALLISRIAVVIERCVRVAGEQLPAERIPVPVRSRARLGSLDPSFDLRVEDVDLVQPVVALHVVTAEDVDAAVGQGHPGVAVHVVEHAFRVAILLEGRPVHGEVGLVEQGCMELAAVLERVGVADVEQ